MSGNMTSEEQTEYLREQVQRLYEDIGDKAEELHNRRVALSAARAELEQMRASHGRIVDALHARACRYAEEAAYYKSLVNGDGVSELERGKALLDMALKHLVHGATEDRRKRAILVLALKASIACDQYLEEEA